MKKTVILVLIIIALVIYTLYLSGKKTCECKKKTSTPYASTASAGPSANANLILSKEEDLLSYSVVLTGIKKDIKDIFFVIAEKELHQASGAKQIASHVEEVILHGLWRQTSEKAFGASEVAALKDGSLALRVRFADDSKQIINLQSSAN
jgi:hypothetical protein